MGINSGFKGLMNTSLEIIKKVLQQIYLYTVLIQGISTSFIDQIPTLDVFRKMHLLLVSEFPRVCDIVSQII